MYGPPFYNCAMCNSHSESNLMTGHASSKQESEKFVADLSPANFADSPDLFCPRVRVSYRLFDVV